MTRPWIMHQGTIYMGDPGQTHDEVVQKFKVPPSDNRDEGVVEDGKVSAHNKELIPQVLRYYDKHYKDDDTIHIAAAPVMYRTGAWREAEYRGRHQAPGPEGAPFHDAVTPNDDSDYSPAFPPDIYDHPEWYMHPANEGYHDTVRALRAARGNPEHPVTIYRAAPKPEFNTGDWVTPSLEYAKMHAQHPDDPEQDMPVHAITVPAKHINTNADYLPEWGYNGPSTMGQRTGAWREGTANTLGYYARLVLADIEEGLKVNSATKISGSRWAYLNGQIRQGEYYPDLIYNLAKDQGLQEADQLSNLVAINDWPLTQHNLAIGSWWNGKPQIERSNLDRQEVAEAIRALAGS